MRIVVRVSDDKGSPVSGADVVTTRADGIVGDHMTTDDSGIAYVVVTALESASTKSEVFTVKVSHPDYRAGSMIVTAERGVNRDYEAPIRLSRQGGLLPVSITVLERGSRHPI